MTLARRDLPAVREAQDLSAGMVPHLDASAVQRIIEAARFSVRTGERNALLSPPSSTGLSGSRRACVCAPRTSCGQKAAGPFRCSARAGSRARWP